MDVVSDALKTEVTRLRSSGDRVVFIRKKLIPLRKGMTVEPKNERIERRTVRKEIEPKFLKIEKVDFGKYPLEDS